MVAGMFLSFGYLILCQILRLVIQGAPRSAGGRPSSDNVRTTTATSSITFGRPERDRSANASTPPAS
jgi:hypothetical protein